MFPNHELITYYSKKFNLPGVVSLPLSPAMRQLVAGPMLQYSDRKDGPTVSGMLDCGFDMARAGRYAFDPNFRQQEDLSIIRANVGLGDRFIRDWLSPLLATCRQVRREIHGIEVNAYYENDFERAATSPEAALRFILREILKAMSSGQGIVLIPNQWFRILWDQEGIRHDFLACLAAQHDNRRSSLCNMVLQLAGRPDLRHAMALSEYCLATAAEAMQQKLQGQINLLGFFDSTGLGNNSHMFARALETFLPAPLPSAVPDAPIRSYRTSKYPDGKSRTVICANPNDCLRLYLNEIEATAPSDHRIGFFLWETSKAPAEFKLGCNFVDEIWVPTQFLKPVFEEVAGGRPVQVVGKEITRGRSTPIHLRRSLNVPDSAKVFLVIGEFGSSIERKNFLATVRAFKQAVRDPAEGVMVLKLKSLETTHWSNRGLHWERVMQEIQGDPRFRVLVARYSDPEYWGLIEESDAMVSLHRGEGFGYGLAHAMLAGKPTVSVSWSGEADFCDAETAFVVEHDLVPVEPWMMNASCYLGNWAEARIESAAEQIRLLLDNPATVATKVAAGRNRIETLYSPGRFAKTLQTALHL